MVMPFDNGFNEYNLERFRSAGTLVLGRKTFEEFRQYWPSVADDESHDATERELSRLNTAIEKVLVSDTLSEADARGWGPARAVKRADAHREIEELKQGDGGDILVIGSRTVWNDLLSAGLVDELHLMIGAGLVGDGLRAFDGAVPKSLRLLDARRFDASNLVLTRYAVHSGR